MKEILIQAAIQYLAPIAASLLSIIIIWILKQVSQLIGGKVKDQRIASALERICYTTATTVMEIEQKVVPALKEATSDGKLDRYDQARIKALAIKKVKERLQPEVMKQAGGAIRDIDSWISGKIEQMVLTGKQ